MTISNSSDAGNGFFGVSSYVKEMETFDLLPAPLKRALDREAHLNYSAVEVQDMLDQGGTVEQLLRMICPRNTS